MATVSCPARTFPFEIEVVSDNGEKARVQIRGPLNQRFEIKGEDPLAAAMGFGAYGREVLLDLSEVTHFGTSGLSWLLAANKRMEKCGGRLVIHSLPPVVRNVIRVLHVQSVLNIADNEMLAERALAGDNA